MTITDRQRQLLNALAEARKLDTPSARTHARAFGYWWSPADLHRHGLLTETISVSKIHRDARALISQGLITQRKYSGALYYFITEAGNHLLLAQ